MKKILIALVLSIAVSASASDVYRVYVSAGTNDIAAIIRQQAMADPTPLAVGEVKLGGPDANPKRYAGTFVFPTNPIIHLQWDAALTNVVVMDATEIASKDAAIAQAASDNKDISASNTLKTAFNTALAKTLAELANTQTTNVVRIFYEYYRPELDN